LQKTAGSDDVKPNACTLGFLGLGVIVLLPVRFAATLFPNFSYGTIVGVDTFSFADPTVFTRTVSGNWTDTTGWTPNGVPNGNTASLQLNANTTFQIDNASAVTEVTAQFLVPVN
jgi:hypothetical protein